MKIQNVSKQTQILRHDGLVVELKPGQSADIAKLFNLRSADIDVVAARLFSKFNSREKVLDYEKQEEPKPAPAAQTPASRRSNG